MNMRRRWIPASRVRRIVADFKPAIMKSRAAEIVKTLRLEPHPEGGFYREFHRSAATVAPGGGGGPRSALTAAFFLLRAGDISRWHCVRWDEQWTHLDGQGVDLHVLDPVEFRLETIRLGPPGVSRVATAVVTGGWWQAAKPAGDFALVSCTVGPGFDFADLAFMADDARAAERLRAAHPDAARLL